MVKVEAGTVTMGAAENDATAYPFEKPAHQVTLTNGYWIAEAQVTQTLWQAVMYGNGAMIGMRFIRQMLNPTRGACIGRTPRISRRQLGQAAQGVRLLSRGNTASDVRSANIGFRLCLTNR